MKNIKLILMSIAVFVLSGCNYLDIVPDGVVEIESQFANQAGVRSALGKCYEYLPYDNYVHNTTTIAGDEYCFPENPSVGFATGAYTKGNTLTRGFQKVSDPVMNFWEGKNGATNLYEGIRYCNIFLENVDKVNGVPQSMVNDWKAQVIVLRAYYHYLLVRCYGPVLIYTNSLDLSSTPDQIRAFRTPLEDCFKFIVGEYDKALNMSDFSNNRRQSRTENLLFDKVVTRALKAKAYLLRASKLFNGHNMYENFKDSQGRLMIDAAHYDGEAIWQNRWEDAKKAIDEAIAAAEEAGLGLYEYTDTPPDWDRNNFKSPDEGGSEIIQYCYNLRYMIVQPDVTANKEVVWASGKTNQAGGSYTMQTATQIRTFQKSDAAGNFYNDDGNTESGYAYGWCGASYAMEEAFYTKNGVPIEEDKTFDYARRNSLVTIPDDPYYRSYLNVGKTTVRQHLDREPRYYAWLLVDKGQYRDYDRLIPDVDFFGAPVGWVNGSGTSSYDYIASGIGIKKFVHPASKNFRLSSVVTYALPSIRMADLYLMRAEAYCMLGEDLATAIESIDKVRARAGLKGVAESWDNYSNNPGKYSTKDGLMEIIKKERQVELCFEGVRYFDIVRWMDAGTVFTKPIQGWYYKGTTANMFYKVTTYHTTQWSNKNYLWPISENEINKNPNLVQNPWW